MECIKRVECTKCSREAMIAPFTSLLLNPSQPNNPLHNHPGAWPRPFSGNMRAWKSDHSARGPLSVWRSNCNQNANCSPVWREHQFRQRMIWSPIAVKRSIKEFPNIRLWSDTWHLVLVESAKCKHWTGSAGIGGTKSAPQISENWWRGRAFAVSLVLSFCEFSGLGRNLHDLR